MNFDGHHNFDRHFFVVAYSREIACVLLLFRWFSVVFLTLLVSLPRSLPQDAFAFILLFSVLYTFPYYWETLFNRSSYNEKTQINNNCALLRHTHKPADQLLALHTPSLFLTCEFSSNAFNCELACVLGMLIIERDIKSASMYYRPVFFTSKTSWIFFAADTFKTMTTRLICTKRVVLLSLQRRQHFCVLFFFFLISVPAFPILYWRQTVISYSMSLPNNWIMDRFVNVSCTLLPNSLVYRFVSSVFFSYIFLFCFRKIAPLDNVVLVLV